MPHDSGRVKPLANALETQMNAQIDSRLAPMRALFQVRLRCRPTPAPPRGEGAARVMAAKSRSQKCQCALPLLRRSAQGIDVQFKRQSGSNLEQQREIDALRHQVHECTARLCPVSRARSRRRGGALGA